MAPLPKKRHSTERKGKRRASIRLRRTALNKCPQCKSLTKPHQVCGTCGCYKGLDVMQLEKKKPKKAATARNEK